MTTLTEKILDYLQLQAENTVDLIDTLLSDRRTAMQKMRNAIVHGPPGFKKRWTDVYRERQNFYSLMNRLKRDGFIVKKGERRGSDWHITKAGIKHLERLKENPSLSAKLLRRRYIKKESASPVIVTFDIPERERRKRNWLRMQLVALGFEMLQRSVWIGKIQIPNGFMIDIRQQGIIPYIHILSVNKSGSIIRKL